MAASLEVVLRFGVPHVYFRLHYNYAIPAYQQEIALFERCGPC